MICVAFQEGSVELAVRVVIGEVSRLDGAKREVMNVQEKAAGREDEKHVCKNEFMSVHYIHRLNLLKQIKLY